MSQSLAGIYQDRRYLIVETPADCGRGVEVFQGDAPLNDSFVWGTGTYGSGLFARAKAMGANAFLAHIAKGGKLLPEPAFKEEICR